MSLVTPKKRPVILPISTESTDEDEDEDNRAFGGEAIDWQDHDLQIGPTPQKHGRVIGLFDHLSPRPIGFSQRLAVEPAELPRGAEKRSAEKAFKHEKTTARSPLKTPSFLRRQELQLDPGSTPRRLFPALPKRGLSTLINELRQLEDEEEDEGMAVLREMEASLDNRPPDDRAQSPSEKDEKAELNDEKVKWKKKGLKRSHRRVIMRPTTKRAAPDTKSMEAEKVVAADDDDSDEYINSADEAADELAAQGKTAPPPQTQPTGKVKGPAKRPGGVSQNFKSLKLRNSGAKGGSRFGRGRFGGRR